MILSASFKMNAGLGMRQCPKVSCLLHFRSTQSVNKSASSWAGTNFINQQGVLSIYVAIQLMTENDFGVKKKKKNPAVNFHSPRGH